MVGMEAKRARLLRLLHQKSYNYSPDKPFILSSGRTSPFYIDCKMTVSDPEGARLIGEIFFELIQDEDIAAIGGLTMGADPLAVATSLVSLERGKPIKSFFIRKAAKGHGRGRRIEGDVQKGDRVVIVEDVITTGSSVLEAVKAAQEFGLEVVKVVALVDREEGGESHIKAHIPRLTSVFTVGDLRDLDR